MHTKQDRSLVLAVDLHLQVYPGLLRQPRSLIYHRQAMLMIDIRKCYVCISKGSHLEGNSDIAAIGIRDFLPYFSLLAPSQNY